MVVSVWLIASGLVSTTLCCGRSASRIRSLHPGWVEFIALHGGLDGRLDLFVAAAHQELAGRDEHHRHADRVVLVERYAQILGPSFLMLPSLPGVERRDGRRRSFRRPVFPAGRRAGGDHRQGTALRPFFSGVASRFGHRQNVAAARITTPNNPPLTNEARRGPGPPTERRTPAGRQSTRADRLVAVVGALASILSKTAWSRGGTSAEAAASRGIGCSRVGQQLLHQRVAFVGRLAGQQIVQRAT